MKTTLELDDALLTQAKDVAAKRRTTLKDIVEQALRRELALAPEITNPDPNMCEVGPLFNALLALALKHKTSSRRVSVENATPLISPLEDLPISHAVSSVHETREP
jgi:hypothetical protein